MGVLGSRDCDSSETRVEETVGYFVPLWLGDLLEARTSSLFG